eukprot:2463703-Rhodomonas_salina.2
MKMTTTRTRWCDSDSGVNAASEEERDDGEDDAAAGRDAGTHRRDGQGSKVLSRHHGTIARRTRDAFVKLALQDIA